MAARLVEEPIVVKEEVFSYFQNLFSKSWEVRPLVIDNFISQLDSQACRELVDVFSWEEILNAIKTSDGNNAPEPDGFTMLFIHKCWD